MAETGAEIRAMVRERFARIATAPEHEKKIPLGRRVRRPSARPTVFSDREAGALWERSLLQMLTDAVFVDRKLHDRTGFQT